MDSVSVVKNYSKAGRTAAAAAAYLGDKPAAEIYANKLKHSYDNIQDVIILEAFNTMTDYLMGEQYIAPEHLLAAIKDFETSKIGIKCLDKTTAGGGEYYTWTQFTELAKNGPPVSVSAPDPDPDLDEILINLGDEPETDAAAACAADAAAIKSYRKINRSKFIFDKHDETYATKLKSCYECIKNDLIYTEFNKMSENIMKETYILRPHLLNAILDFELSPIGKKCLAEKQQQHNNAWGQFSDNAFNCRPYQPCTIS